MDKLIEEVFDEVIMEADDGIKYKDITIKFHTLEKYLLNSSYNDCIPILIIKNKKELVNKIKQYIKLIIEVKKLNVNRSSIKKCLILLFANACYEDFSNPTRFVDNYINFYLNTDFMENDKIKDNIIMKKMSQSITAETPYIFKTYIKDGDNKYYLPSISYGISEDICYIYKMEQVSKNENIEFNKKIEDKYDVNNLALFLFMNELYDYGISKIKVVSYLPMRINSNDACNLLDKFISLNYIYDNINVTSHPFELDEYMHIELEDFNDSTLLVRQNLERKVI